MIYVPYFGGASNDPYFANVSLLVQGGIDGGLVINDLSSYATSVTIANYASFDDSHQVFGANAIRATTLGADIPSFTSSGTGSRFTRPSNEAATIECFAYFTALDPTTANWLFLWDTGVGNRLMELGFGGDSGILRLRIGDDTEVYSSVLLPNTLYFIQITIIDNTYYMDVGAVPGDGTTTQEATGTAPISDTAGTTNFRVARHFNVSTTGSASGLWVSPIRVTKGVARSRGAVPTEAFPTF